ncbi:MAG TPA: hypothetical protein VNI83_10885 [Vicinamibacterales bacterium]|nr:hypothetical protein [Vicinamibacterales bacterium]
MAASEPICARKTFRESAMARPPDVAAGIAPRGGAERDEERLAEEARGVDGEAAVRHADRRVALDGGGETRPEVAGQHQLVSGAQELVPDHRDVEVGDDAEEPVAAHRQAEELGVHGGGARQEVAGGQHEAEGADSRAEGTVGHGPAVGVHGERAGDAEVVVRLHDGRREAEGIEGGDDLSPARAGGDAAGHGAGVDLDVRRRAVDIEGHRDAVARERPAAHRVARGAYRDGAALGRRGLQLGAERVEPGLAGGRARAPVAGIPGGFESAGVVECEAVGGSLRDRRRGPYQPDSGSADQYRATRDQGSLPASGASVTRTAFCPAPTRAQGSD